MQLASTYLSNCLKKFVIWNCFYKLVTSKEVESKDSNSLKEFENNKDEGLLLVEALICRSACI